MELWIRSQDKKVLTKCDDIRIETTDTDKICVIRGYFDDNNWVRLGKYKAKKRALEVLDEIQYVIRLKYSWRLSEDSFKITMQKYGREQAQEILDKMYVYEMPEE